MAMYEIPEHPLIAEWEALMTAQRNAIDNPMTASMRQIGASILLSDVLQLTAVAILKDPVAFKIAKESYVLGEIASYLANAYNGQTGVEWWGEFETIHIRRQELHSALCDGDHSLAQSLSWANLSALSPGGYNVLPDELLAEEAECKAILAGEPLRLKRRRGRPRKQPK